MSRMPIPSSSNGPMSESSTPSNYFLNKEYLLEFVMEQLELTKSDLDLPPEQIKAKVRDLKISKILKDN